MQRITNSFKVYVLLPICTIWNLVMKGSSSPKLTSWLRQQLHFAHLHMTFRKDLVWKQIRSLFFYHYCFFHTISFLFLPLLFSLTPPAIPTRLLPCFACRWSSVSAWCRLNPILSLEAGFPKLGSTFFSNSSFLIKNLKCS